MKLRKTITVLIAILIVNICTLSCVYAVSDIEPPISSNTSSSGEDIPSGSGESHTESSEAPPEVSSAPESKAESTHEPVTPSSSTSSDKKKPVTSSKANASSKANSKPVSSKPSSEKPKNNNTSSQNTTSKPEDRVSSTPIYTVSAPKTSSESESNISSEDTSSILAYEETSSVESGIILPEINSGDISMPVVIGSMADNDNSSKDNFFKGMIAWCCIGVGVILVLTVIFGSSYNKSSNKGNHKTKGRKHYKASKSRRRKKRLLSDKYYYDNRL